MNHVLDAPPKLGALYAKAILGARASRGDALPDSTYTLTGQRVDPEHLAAYQRVCGFRVGDVLPPTYPHVLAFPLAMALMAEPAFPFPLPGLVHIANAIEVRRAIAMDEALDFTVRAADLRAHDVGRQVDVIAEASVDGEPVWTGRSTYLRRGKPGSDSSGERAKREPAPRPDASPARIRVPGDVGRRYAAVSGDRNPIHLHPLTARAFGFPTAIAHGMWLAARALATLEGRVPAAVRYEVAFKTPVLLPSTIEVFATGGWQLDVRSAKSGKPHLSGTVR